MMKLLYKKHKLLGNKGFSLVELIIVIAIMAVLMAVLAPQLIKYVEKSRVQTDQTAATELLNAVKIALTEEAIYSTVETNDQITWAGTTIVVNSAAQGDLEDELVATLGSLTQKITSKTYQDQTYTITIALDTNGAPSAIGGWVAPVAP